MLKARKKVQKFTRQGKFFIFKRYSLSNFTLIWTTANICGASYCTLLAWHFWHFLASEGSYSSLGLVEAKHVTGSRALKLGLKCLGNAALVFNAGAGLHWVEHTPTNLVPAAWVVKFRKPLVATNRLWAIVGTDANYGGYQRRRPGQNNPVEEMLREAFSGILDFAACTTLSLRDSWT